MFLSLYLCIRTSEVWMVIKKNCEEHTKFCCCSQKARTGHSKAMCKSQSCTGKWQGMKRHATCCKGLSVDKWETHVQVIVPLVLCNSHVHEKCYWQRLLKHSEEGKTTVYVILRLNLMAHLYHSVREGKCRSEWRYTTVPGSAQRTKISTHEMRISSSHCALKGINRNKILII